MKKDIVYIDIEDDITAIISKVKSSKDKIVALVPPKRIGVLQSAVNLRLLQRTAERSNKHIVLITGSQALTGLAAAAMIPVARNLQSKPEIAEIPALEIDDGEDIIDGALLPIGDHAKTAASGEVSESDAEEAELIQGINIDSEPPVGPTPAGPAARNTKKKSGKKVPNFSNFRKRFAIIISVLVLLVGTLVWAFVFAPAATIAVTVNTTAIPINGVVVLGSETNAEQGTIKSIEQKTEEEISIEFEATGEEDRGNKATGTVRFTSTSPNGRTIPAGTQLQTSGGLTFSLRSAVNLPAATLSFECGGICPASASGTAEASEPGEDYNAASGSLSGAPSGVSASFTGATSGGTTKMVAVVTESDMQSAREKLTEQSTDLARQKLMTQFASGTKAIEASFDVEYTDVKAEPDVNGEVEGDTAKLTAKAVYTIAGVEELELHDYLEQTLKQQMQDQTVQKIYNSGAAEAKLSDFAKNGDSRSVRLVASGQIGPTVEESEVRERVAGKRFGDIQQDLTKINGISDVDVKYSFFWVRTVPKNHDKITVEFDIKNASQ